MRLTALLGLVVFSIVPSFALAQSAQAPAAGGYLPADSGLAKPVSAPPIAAPPTVPAGSKVFLEPMEGFETYLAAAIEKKKVPVTLVASKENADFIVTGNAEHEKAGWAKIVIMGNIHSDEQASVSIVDVKTGEIVFAYAVNKKNSFHGLQTSAEACAKHLKDRMDGKEK